jgi:hypothetical protein
MLQGKPPPETGLTGTRLSATDYPLLAAKMVNYHHNTRHCYNVPEPPVAIAEKKTKRRRRRAVLGDRDSSEARDSRGRGRGAMDAETLHQLRLFPCSSEDSMRREASGNSGIPDSGRAPLGLESPTLQSPVFISLSGAASGIPGGAGGAGGAGVTSTSTAITNILNNGLGGERGSSSAADGVGASLAPGLGSGVTLGTPQRHTAGPASPAIAGRGLGGRGSLFPMQGQGQGQGEGMGMGMGFTSMALGINSGYGSRQTHGNGKCTISDLFFCFPKKNFDSQFFFYPCRADDAAITADDTPQLHLSRRRVTRNYPKTPEFDNFPESGYFPAPGFRAAPRPFPDVGQQHPPLPAHTHPQRPRQRRQSGHRDRGRR